ncbi:MAG: cohesin domain-containing protein, partial [Euryarchaeota archaeon]|nr:cohesin domain-containing protein [Euryarchaeota archaeon]
PIKDMDCDDKPDILVYQERYDPETERYHYKIIAKKGNDGTHLLWGESDEYIRVAWPCWSWEPYPDVDETSVQASAFNQSTENVIPVPELFGYDLDCDEKSDLLIGISNMMYALTVERPENTVYFKPQHSSASYCNTVDVEIWVNATNLGSGQINLTYDPGCANVTNWTRDTTNFPMGGESYYAGRVWITFMTLGQLTGDYMVGTLTIHCVNEGECKTPLAFADGSKLFDEGGSEILAMWIDGTFECIIGLCGDVAPYPDCDLTVNMGDVKRLLMNVSYPGQYPLCCEWCGDVAPCPANDDEINMGDVKRLLMNVSQPGQYPLCCG